MANPRHFPRQVILLRGDVIRAYKAQSHHPTATRRERGSNPYEAFKQRHELNELLLFNTPTPEYPAYQPIRYPIDQMVDLTLIAYPAHGVICTLGYPAGLFWKIADVKFVNQRLGMGVKGEEILVSFQYYKLQADGKIKPCGLTEWAIWFEDVQNRQVKQTTLTDEDGQDILISTVFLGIDHNTGGDGGPPLLWETMILGGLEDGWQNRYTSNADALADHEAQVARLTTDFEQRRTLLPPGRPVDPVYNGLFLPMVPVSDALPEPGRITLDAEISDQVATPLPPRRPILDDLA